MTIFRSDVRGLMLLALAAGVAPAAVAQVAARPSHHTVQTGDTLWDLSARYLGDPFLWPQIYRLNTGIVADPHWIYPGQVLQLAAGEDTRAVPSDTPQPSLRNDERFQAPPAMPGADAGSLFARRPRMQVGAMLLTFTDESYRALSRGDFYSSGFMTEGHDLPYGTFVGNAEPSQIASMGERSFTLLNDPVLVRPPEGATYRLGDTLLVLTLAEGYSGSPQWGDMVVPTGLLEITGQGDGQMLAKVLAIYGELRNGQHLLPAERFVSSGTVRAKPVSNGLSAQVIKARENNPIRHPQDVLFIDAGRSSGVAAGDLFEVLRESDEPGMAMERIATLQVVHVRETTATVRVTSLISPDFPHRATVRKIGSLGN
ncbi:MAG: LysM peptidoglycan-binding domain-containing protein [Gemmatimonadota bacterium]|nr:LysM peptidoglycan-binding domain-containing protein [Gemmatimonadota bacterium]